MNVKVMQITPEIAKEWLEKNPTNRKLSQPTIDKYANDIARGGWQENGEAICFNRNGNLTNGQHRLHAVVKSGCAITAVVVLGVDDDVTLYDRGRLRSAADSMVLKGMYATNRTVAMARTWLYETGRTSGVSESEIEAFHTEHADSIDVVMRIVKSGHKKGRVNVKAAYFTTALLNAYEAGVDEETLQRFVVIVKSGFYDSPTESAAVVIRNDILTGMITGRSMPNVVNGSYMVENAIKDFTAGYRRKKTYKNTTSKVYGKEKKDE